MEMVSFPINYLRTCFSCFRKKTQRPESVQLCCTALPIDVCFGGGALVCHWGQSDNDPRSWWFEEEERRSQPCPWSPRRLPRPSLTHWLRMLDSGVTSRAEPSRCPGDAKVFWMQKAIWPSTEWIFLNFFVYVYVFLYFHLFVCIFKLFVCVKYTYFVHKSVFSSSV